MAHNINTNSVFDMATIETIYLDVSNTKKIIKH